MPSVQSSWLPQHISRTIRIFLSLILLVPSLGCLRMGKMEGCDDGNHLWMKDVETEGGLSFNTHCDPDEISEFGEAKLTEPLSRCELDEEKLGPGEHRCMSQAITYERNTIPVSGRHRPVWPVYGEYRFLPPQRWIHNLEHGGLVFLFHPCADSTSVDKMRSLVTGCLRRHIITPSRRLVTPQRPFALVTWGCYLNFGNITAAGVIDWIHKNALRKDGLQKAPENNYWKDGDFNHLLVHKAEVVSDNEDSVVCPQF